MSRLHPMMTVARLIVFVSIIPMLYFASINVGVSYNSDLDRYVQDKIKSRGGLGVTGADVQKIIQEAKEEVGFENPPTFNEFKSHAYSQVAIIAAIFYLLLFIALKGSVVDILAFVSMALVFEFALHFDPGRFLWAAIAALASLLWWMSLRAKAGWKFKKMD